MILFFIYLLFFINKTSLWLAFVYAFDTSIVRIYYYHSFSLRVLFRLTMTLLFFFFYHHHSFRIIDERLQPIRKDCFQSVTFV